MNHLSHFVVGFLMAAVCFVNWNGQQARSDCRVTIDGKLVIVDARGRPAITLEATDAGGAIRLLANGKPSLEISTGVDGGAISLLSEAGESAASIEVDANSSGLIRLLAPGSHEVVRIGAQDSQDGRGGVVVIRNAKGFGVGRLGAHPKGYGQLDVWNDTGTLHKDITPLY